jgi:hypothetical protein
MTLKVNLSEITNLVKRGRQAVIDQALLADIMSLDANVVGDAFIYADAQGDPTDDEFVNHKNSWRGRVAKAGEACDRDCSILWTTAGEMVVSLKPVKAKRNRK